MKPVAMPTGGATHFSYARIEMEVELGQSDDGVNDQREAKAGVGPFAIGAGHQVAAEESADANAGEHRPKPLEQRPQMRAERLPDIGDE